MTKSVKKETGGHTVVIEEWDGDGNLVTRRPVTYFSGFLSLTFHNDGGYIVIKDGDKFIIDDGDNL